MELKLVKCDPKYYEFIRLLRTNPEITKSFLSQIKITKDDQINYMTKYHNGYFICLQDNKPVGFIGIVDKDLRLAVSKEGHNKGIATFMLQGVNEMNLEYEVQIKSDNIASINFFEKNGFIKKASKYVDSTELLIMKKS